jgi:hypothetical protein
MLVVALIVAGLLVWGGATLLRDAWWGRQRVDLVDQLMPYQTGSVADEAQRWLDRQT